MKITENVFLLSGLPLGQGENVYAVRHSGGLALIDTGRGAAAKNAILYSIEDDGLAGLPITHVLLTHMHDDHIGNAPYFRSLGAQILCSEPDASGVEEGGIRVNDYGIDPVPTCKVDRRLSDGEMFDIGGIQFTVFYTPGHTCGSVFYLFSCDGKSFCATGDTAYAAMGKGGTEAGLGWLGSYELDKKAYIDSLKKAVSLKFDVLLGGHGFPVIRNGSRIIGMAFRKALMEWR